MTLRFTKIRFQSRRWLFAFLALIGLSSGCGKLVSPEVFTSEVAEAIRKTDTSLSITIVQPLKLEIRKEGKDATTMFLNNAYSMYKQDPDSKKLVIDNRVRGFIEIISGKTEQISRDRIVPVIKDINWIKDITATLSASKASFYSDIAQEPLNGKLIVVYAVDLPSSMSFLTNEKLTKLGLSRDENLQKLAVANLRNVIPNIEIRGSHGSYMITAGGAYEASLILFDDLWERMASKVNGEIVIAVPARDLLLVTGSNDKDGLERMRKVVSGVPPNEGYAISDALFVYRDKHFVEFKPH